MESGKAAPASITDEGQPGSYTLRELIRDVPLSTDDDGVRAHITCVDTWNGNLYIGTSAGEVLHYVSLPPDPTADDEDDDSGQPVYIFATKIEPPYTTEQTGPDAGVKQILLLPSAGKACIVCNSTLTFYSLPELSPAWDGKYTQSGCLWVGGLDRNELEDDEGPPDAGTVVVICLRARVRLIRIEGVSPQKIIKIRDIELRGVSTLERRGDLACVADAQAYSLLDVVNQRKNELFPISSLSETRTPPAQQDVLAPPLTPGRQASRSFSSRSPVRNGRSHQRIISLGGQPQNANRPQPEGNSPWPARGSSRTDTESPDPVPNRDEGPTEEDETSTSTPTTEPQKHEATTEKAYPLLPNIVTPLPNEFMLTTGTKRSDPGVGMFVNLEGDVVRGTMEFTSYPESLVLDGSNDASVMPDEASTQGFVLAVVRKQVEDKLYKSIEIQRWDIDPGEANRTREWLHLEAMGDESEAEVAIVGLGLRSAKSPSHLAATGISTSLRLRKLKITDTAEDDAVKKRNDEEDKLASRFAQVRANILLFTNDRVSWIMREPIILQLDKQLNGAMQQSESGELSVDVPVVQRVVNSIRGQDPRNELEFLTLTYVRQKSALLLFGNLVVQTASGTIAYEHDKRRTEDALTSGEIDPRVVLTLVPPLDKEISEGPGIWMAQGLRDTVTWLRDGLKVDRIKCDVKGAYGDNMLSLIKRYLTDWRKKKGFGSVADESHVFRTVDAALLHVLLMLDQNTPRGAGVHGSVRLELNEVVDKGVDCFDRAVELFEQYQRLHVLSRLYQSRKNASQVLATWKRIMEGEKDAGGELVEGEQQMRKYLSNIRDTQLVQDYGSWLANRNPKLGVQVFADDNSRIKFEPSEAVAILKDKAPGAVKDYLEHLVFGKNHVQYVNDLIAFYLDTVLAELESNEQSRKTLLESYETYRALHPPKPTYREFITDNAIDADWWHNRLRLLQLIGGSHGAASKYNVHTLGQRLAPYSNELVPEMIILNGREGRHEEALRLLTHGLGDYDTAIRYCLLGGRRIFHPSSLTTTVNPDSSPSLPTHDEQSILFTHLLHEFFRIEDAPERLERTAELLERFGGWFDFAEVLDWIPDGWSVELVGGFLVKGLRGLVRERHETGVVRGLCEAQNLRCSAEAVGMVEKMGVVVMESGGEEGLDV